MREVSVNEWNSDLETDHEGRMGKVESGKWKVESGTQNKVIT